ncbi:hypothetical protein EIN_281190 [Entamoeba invadens IP1]|uniref:Uncharacterized protein n=1 Tax=Entamoeba invadens IP1 TaxID=370355 RepID=A0A0A1TWX9_ENTIV|nr:hypothetical protein EIN_281190 [Entamoeba invadens IP1]ELP85758.1 hypothetical protein EIN_281190 [Entamoeba invadens IP1]|eukprot:XP_004185104.1 hypothetical protein EIN_281190 [Entamoeba invadens IP1]
MLFQLCLLINNVFSSTLFVKSPCIPNLRVESLNYLGISGDAGTHAKITRDCNKEIPNKEKEVLALSSHTNCYVSEDNFYRYVKGIKYPQCGACVELVGPSLKKAVCTIVGAFSIDPTNNNEISDFSNLFPNGTENFQNAKLPNLVKKIDIQKYSNKMENSKTWDFQNTPQEKISKNRGKNSDSNLENQDTKETTKRTFFVNNDLFRFLAGYEDNKADIGVSIPIVAQFVNCPSKTPPCAVMTKETKQSNGTSLAHVSIFNTNQLTLKVEYNNNFYYFDENMQFNILFERTENQKDFLRVHDIFGGRVVIPFSFEINQTYQSTTISQQYYIIEDNCSLVLSNQLFVTKENDDPAMIWGVRHHDNDDLKKSVILNNTRDVLFNKTVYLSTAFPFPIKISKHYAILNLKLETTVPLIEIPLLQIFSYVGNTSTMEEVKCSKDFIYRRNVTYKNGVYYIDARSSMTMARCYSQMNLMLIKYVSNQVGKVSITHFSFDQAYPLNFTMCSVEDLRCTKDDECDPTNSTIDSEDGKIRVFKKGCIPFCGICSKNEVCNKNAKCVTKKTMNTRNCESTLFMLLTVLFIVLV